MKRTVLLLLLLGSVPIPALAQSPRVFTPEKPPRPDEETILNARVAKVDVANRRLTVRGVDVKGDGGPTETFPVVTTMADRLAELRPGMEVLLTLLGQTAIDIKVAAASGGPTGTPVRGTGARPGTATGRTNAAPPAQVIAPSGAAGAGTPPGSIVITPSTGAAGTTVAPGTLTNEDLRSGTTSATPAPAPRRNPRTSASPATAASPRPRTVASPQPVVSPQPMVSPQPGVPMTGGVIAPGVVIPGVVLPPGAAPVGIGPIGGVIAIGADPSPSPMGTPFPTPRPVGTPVPVGPRPQISPVTGPTPAPQPTPVPVLVPAPPSPTPTPPPVS